MGTVMKDDDASELASRRRRVATLLVARVPLHQMAQTLEIDEATLLEDIVSVREDWQQRSDLGNETVIAEELASLNEIERRIRADHFSRTPVDPAAVAALLQVHDRRSRLLKLDIAAKPVDESMFGKNRLATEEMITALTDSGMLEKVDAPRVATVRALSDAIDKDPSNASLWREYRSSMERLRSVPDGSADEFTKLVESLSAEVGDSTNSRKKDARS